MTERKREGRAELQQNITTAPPAVELLANPATAQNFWPEQVARDPEFIRQIESRKVLNDRLDVVLAKVPRPDVSLEDAIKQGSLTEKEVAELYDSLSSLFEEGPDYERLALYLPFEFLPRNGWKPSSATLKKSSQRFQAAYMGTWNAILRFQDVRANFVDGDVLETDRRVGDLPRVVKAAHLIPKLVEKGLVDVADVLGWMKTTEDETLKHSIADTIPVLTDLGLLGQAELTELQASSDQYIRDKAALAATPIVKRPKQDILDPKNLTAAAIQKKIEDAFRQIEAKDYAEVTKKRADWLRSEEKRNVIEARSDEVAAAIEQNKIKDEAVVGLTASKTYPESQQAFTEGIRKAIESAAHTDRKQGQKLYATYRDTLQGLWKRDNVAAHDMLSKTFCRLHGLGVIETKELSALGLVLPALAGPFSENLKAMSMEMEQLKEIVASIEKNPELSKYIYPVALVFGSALKGYRAHAADIDVGVFIRPETPAADAQRLRAMLKKTFTHEKIQGQVVEFWLKHDGANLRVHDDAKATEPWIGESSWTHVLFGAAWQGEEQAIKELRKKLLAPYFAHDPGKTFQGRAARGVYLEELERDTLQYRLMHRGYAQFFPSFGGIDTAHADSIDGKSAFWDSGYRRMATKLFASRVFLPKLERREK